MLGMLFNNEKVDVKSGDVVINVDKDLYPESIEFENVKVICSEVEFKVTGKVTFDDWGKIDEDDSKPSSSIVNDAENAA